MRNEIDTASSMFFIIKKKKNMDSDKKLIQLSHHAGAKLLEGDGLRCMKGASREMGRRKKSLNHAHTVT